MFEIVVPPNVISSSAGNGGSGSVVHANTKQPMNDGAQKIMLPRRLGEPRFGPQPYYYEASRTGVVPAGMSHS
jgi:hypothetical protein